MGGGALVFSHFELQGQIHGEFLEALPALTAAKCGSINYYFLISFPAVSVRGLSITSPRCVFESSSLKFIFFMMLVLFTYSEGCSWYISVHSHFPRLGIWRYIWVPRAISGTSSANREPVAAISHPPNFSFSKGKQAQDEDEDDQPTDQVFLAFSDEQIYYADDGGRTADDAAAFKVGAERQENKPLRRPSRRRGGLCALLPPLKRPRGRHARGR